MTDDHAVHRRLTEAADFLDSLHEGSSHIPTDLFQPEDERGVVLSRSAERPVAQFFWGGGADVFRALGPAALPILAKWLRSEAADVAMCDSINNKDPDNPGKTRVMYRPQTSDAYAFASHVLEEKP